MINVKIALTLLPDGTVKCSEPLNFPLRHHRQDPNDPLTFVPKFPPCKCLESDCGLSPCKKKVRFKWTCSKFKKRIIPLVCEGCNAREEPELREATDSGTATWVPTVATEE